MIVASEAVVQKPTDQTGDESGRGESEDAQSIHAEFPRCEVGKLQVITGGRPTSND